MATEFRKENTHFTDCVTLWIVNAFLEHFSTLNIFVPTQMANAFCVCVRSYYILRVQYLRQSFHVALCGFDAMHRINIFMGYHSEDKILSKYLMHSTRLGISYITYLHNVTGISKLENLCKARFSDFSLSLIGVTSEFQS